MDAAEPFYGRFEHTIDGKGRLVLPAAYRAAFAEGGFVAFLGEYAALFTLDGWQKYRRRLESSGSFSRVQLQYMFSFVNPFQLDGQHRIGIPSNLREAVGLEQAVTIIGSGSHAAVYARDAWQSVALEANTADDDGRDLVGKIKDLGFL